MSFWFDDLLRCRKTAVFLLLLLCVGMLGGRAATPVHAQINTPGGSAPAQQIELTVDISADPPNPATAVTRIIITIDNNRTGWPNPLLVRFLHPADTTIQGSTLATLSISPVEEDSTSAVYELAPPLSQSQQVRTLNIMLLLEPGDSDDPVLLEVELLSEAGEVLDRATLDPEGQEMLAEERPPAVPGTQQGGTPTPEGSTATVTMAPTATSEVAATSTTEPLATQEPAATDIAVLPPVDDASTGTNIGRVLLIAVLVGVGLLAVLAGLYILYRLMRRPAAVTGPTGKGQPLTPTPMGATTARPAAQPTTVQPKAAFLTLAADPQQRFAIAGERFIIGRASDNDLVISEGMAGSQTVSRRHAAIYRQNGEYVIEDLNSENGVWVNGRATSKNVLQDGWQVVVGSVKFIFHTE